MTWDTYTRIALRLHQDAKILCFIGCTDIAYWPIVVRRIVTMRGEILLLIKHHG